MSSASTEGAKRAEHAEEAPPTAAVCVLRGVGDSGVSGLVTLEPAKSGEGLRLVAEIRGLSPGPHGFHIHDFGDLSDPREGQSVGGHFDPEGHPHGPPDATRRHVGDLGNIEAGADGTARIDILPERIALEGPHGILGRAFVVHEKEDTFGQPSGDAGPRLAFGVIGRASIQPL